MERDHLLALLVVFIILIYLFYNPGCAKPQKFKKDKDSEDTEGEKEGDKKTKDRKIRHEKPKKKTVEELDKEIVASVKNNMEAVGLKGLRQNKVYITG